MSTRRGQNGHQHPHSPKRKDFDRLFLHNELADPETGFAGHMEQFMGEVQALSTNPEIEKPAQQQWDMLFARLEKRMKTHTESGNPRQLHPNWLRNALQKDPESTETAPLDKIGYDALKLYGDTLEAQQAAEEPVVILSTTDGSPAKPSSKTRRGGHFRH